MSNILLILISLFSGILLSKFRVFPKGSEKVLNAFIIYLSLPAITLFYVPKLEWNSEMIFPFLMPTALLLLSFIFFFAIQPILKFSRETFGALVLVAGLGNISFVGYPVVEAIYGSSGLEIAIIVGQGGFLAVSFLGVLIASGFSAKSNHMGKLALDVIKFPPFLAFMIALPLAFFNLDFPLALQGALKQLSGTLTPLAMVSVGLQINFNFEEINWKNVLAGLSFKLFLAPSLIFLLSKFLLSEGSLIGEVSIIESAMPPMVTAAIIATQYELNPKLANFLVGFGLLLSGFSLLSWWWILL